MLSSLVLLFFAWSPQNSFVSAHRAWSQPRVTLPNNTVIHGFIHASSPSVRQFLSIPYAQPPVGDLRFEPPLKNDLSSSVNATKFGKSCTQFEVTVPNVFNTEILEFNTPPPFGEDCLTLSIWTPVRPAHKLPVLIFLYGGGWYTGGESIPYQNPTQWIQRTPSLIVISPNFRGNIFGFSNARGAKVQNVGLLDVRLAVEWVRDNIAAFGGDPSKITLWGQSSGSEAVDMYNTAFYSDPIVTGLIMDSATAFTEDGSGPRYSNFTYVANEVGCGGNRSAEEEFECMKGVDAKTIEDVNAVSYNRGDVPGLSFGACADERTVFSNLTQRMKEGKFSQVPAIVGVNKEDGNVFVQPYTPNSTTPPDQSLSDLYFSLLFLCPSYKTASWRAAAGLPTYRYLYAGNFSNISPLPWLGAYHTSELPMLFGTHGNYRGNSTPYEIAVSEAMQDTWRAFANDPWKGFNGQGWAPFTPENNTVRVFGSNGTVASDEIGILKVWEDQCA